MLKRYEPMEKKLSWGKRRWEGLAEQIKKAEDEYSRAGYE